MIRAYERAAFFIPFFALAASALGQMPNNENVVNRIKSEGLDRSQVMATLSYLSDVIGPRLTASPNMKHANEWTKSKMTEWGLQNAHLEAWGPFGRGWSLERFLTLEEATFLELFATSPIRRAGRAGFLRNVCVAMGNRALPAYAEPLTRALTGDRDALVRGHAAWALGRVAGALPAEALRPESHATLATAAKADPDGWVREEAAVALETLGAR